MQRKELIVILVLGALVALATMCRLSSGPLRPASHRSGRGAWRDTRSSAAPRRPTFERGRLVWPQPRSRYEPQGREARLLFEAAEHIFAEDLYDAAIATYRRFIEKHSGEPTVEVARFRLGQCYSLAERYAEAARAYDEFVERHGGSDLAPMALIGSGANHGRAGDLPRARARLQEVINRYPDTPYAEAARQLLRQLAPTP